MTNVHFRGRARRASFLIVGTATLFAIGSCADSSGPTAADSKPGALNAVFATPNSNDGAVLFTISGGPVDSITRGDLPLAGDMKSGAGLLVMGSVANAAVLAVVWVPDVTRASGYTASVTQAAARTTHALQAAAGYRLTLMRR